jgi:hypothetical protein
VSAVHQYENIFSMLRARGLDVRCNQSKIRAEFIFFSFTNHLIENFASITNIYFEKSLVPPWVRKNKKTVDI